MQDKCVCIAGLGSTVGVHVHTELHQGSIAHGSAVLSLHQVTSQPDTGSYAGVKKDNTVPQQQLEKAKPCLRRMSAVLCCAVLCDAAML